jgi:hypothetical protein
MIDNRIDRVNISREAQVERPVGPTPSWIFPVLRNLYGFMRKWSGTFSNELDPTKKKEREEELIKAVNRSFKGQA